MTTPNIVVFISHDSGRFLSSYGYDTVDTPNFDRLSQMTVQFNRAFCTTPLCAPARSALLTGRYPHQNGMMGLPADTLGGFDLVTKDRHLAKVLANSGYESVLCGFEHETVDFWSVGFERSLHGTGTGHNGGLPLAGAGQEISGWLSNRDDRPFYLQIGCFDTHREWAKTSEPYSERGLWKAPWLIDDDEVDAEMAEQQGAINQLDRGVGEVLDALSSAGALENTVVVFTTDHGIDFPRAKGTLFDRGLEVFLFMGYIPPAGADAHAWGSGVQTDALVSHVDIYPTILEACNIDLPPDLPGYSLLPVLRGEQEHTGRDAVFCEKTYHDNYDPMRGLRTDRFKYVLNFDAQTLYDVRIATAPRYRYFRVPFKKSHREELYDLHADPEEFVNLVSDGAHDNQREQLRRQLARWMAATDDPLLEGAVPSPYHLRISREMKELSGQ